MDTKKVKKVVSTSRIFKPGEPKVTSQPATSDVIKNTERSKPAEAPISDALDTSFTNTSQHLRTTFSTSIDQTHSQLITRLAEASTQAESHYQVEKEVSSLLTRSLAKEALEFTSRDGTKTSSSLGVRMARYEQKVEQSKQGLQELISDLARIEGKLEQCWNDLEVYLNNQCQGRSGTVEAEHDDSHEKMRNDWENRIQEMLSEKIGILEASEQEFNVREKRKSAKFAQSLEMGL